MIEEGRTGLSWRSRHSWVVLALCLTTSTAGELAKPAEPHEEPPAPTATPAVLELVEESEQLLEESEPEQSLTVAVRALEAAVGADDVTGEALSSRARAHALEALQRLDEADAAWRATEAAAQRTGDVPRQVEALCARAILLHDNTERTSALLAAAGSLALGETQRPLAAATSLHKAAVAMYRRRRLDEADLLWRRTLEIREQHARDFAAVGNIVNNLGAVAHDRGKLDVARDYHLRALEIWQEHDPGSRAAARSLNNLGNVASEAGDGELSRHYHLRALKIWQEHDPGSLNVAGSFNNLGIVEYRQGNLEKARDYHLRSLEIKQKHSPDSLAVAASLGNLGIVVDEQGDLTAARAYLLRSLAIWNERAPGSIDVARALGNLGVVARQQGDLEAARDYHLRALAINQQRAPDTLSIAADLGNLGNVALAQEELETAADYHRRSLSIKQVLAPDSPTVAASLHNLGTVAAKRGQLGEARDYHLSALKIRQERAPGSSAVANSLASLGSLARQQGDLDTAQGHYLNALGIDQRHAPDSLAVADSLFNLGAIAHGQGETQTAKIYLQQAWQAIRAQGRGVAGDAARLAFGESTALYAENLTLVQLALGEPFAAFQTLEESRAQALRELLAERSLDSSDVPPELWRSYEESQTVFDSARRELASVGAKSSRIEAELAELKQLDAAESDLSATRSRLEQAEATYQTALTEYTQTRLDMQVRLAEVRDAAPELHAVAMPLDQARASMPADTLYIAFSVGTGSTSVFMVPSDRSVPMHTYTVADSRERLDARVGAFLDLVRERPFNWSSKKKRDIVCTARELYGVLFPEEARAMIGTAERLMLSPDGPLWQLPFAALDMHSSESGHCSRGESQWLGRTKPLTYVQSLSVFARQRQRPPRPAATTPRALIVGAPTFTRGPRTTEASSDTATIIAQASVGQPGERHYLFGERESPAPLPGTLVEASRLANMYGVRALTGLEADEVRVRSQLANANMIHLATHGYLHHRLVMNSGVLLTPPEEEPEIGKTDDDGVLQAWEFMSQIKLQAELVVLSACETGRGDQVRGEGLVGMTRSLQYAGARSIVATHWQIRDDSATEVMVAFHERLLAGESKDEALRQAMAEVSGRAKTRHPGHWAAFLLTGDPARLPWVDAAN